MRKQLPIKIIIADDHEIYRDGLQSVFENTDKYEIIAQCQDGDHLLRAVKTMVPDIVLTDLKMPILSGVEAIRILHKEHLIMSS
jgi:YesN/AraC family two-component response regulator